MDPARAFVIGHPIGHSRSPLMHGYWMQRHGIGGRYEKRDIPPDALGGFIRQFRDRHWVGANVTIPHKVAVMDHLDHIDDVARAMGAVNCIWWDGAQLVGGNTDASGLIGNLDEQAPGWGTPPATAVILGAGGAARAAAFGMRSRGIDVVLVNRTHARAADLARHFGTGVAARPMDDLPELLAQADLLVNATSLGMAGQPPLDIDLSPMKGGAVVCDLVYVPLRTDLLIRAAGHGLRIADGLGMLLHQGAEGFRRWFGVAPAITPELRELLERDIAAGA